MKLLIILCLGLLSFNSFAMSRTGKVLNSVAIATPTVTVISDAHELKDYTRFSLFSYLGTGSTATGTVTIYLSNDDVVSGDLVTNWVTYGTQSIAASTTKVLTSITDVASKWFKVDFTKAANTATATVNTILYIP